MNKELKEALKDIKRIQKELPSFNEKNLKFWLRHMWLGGKIEVYEQNLKRNAK
jgi:hypothetical protein